MDEEGDDGGERGDPECSSREGNMGRVDKMLLEGTERHNIGPTPQEVGTREVVAEMGNGEKQPIPEIGRAHV